MYIQTSVSKLLTHRIIEQVKPVIPALNTQKAICHVVEIGINTFYGLESSYSESIESIEHDIGYLKDICYLTIEKSGFNIIPTTSEERNQFLRLLNNEYQKFLYFLLNFSKRNFNHTLLRSLPEIQKYRVLLELYASISFAFAIYLKDIGVKIPISLNSKGINAVMDILYENALDLGTSNILNFDMKPFVKNYFVSLNFLTESFFPK